MEGRVLIIEDHKGNLQLLQKHFEEADMKIATATTGEEGIKSALNFMPQVIIVSTSLPDMRGSDVAQRLRSYERTKHIHIIMLADEDHQQERINGLKLGVNDFVASPFDPVEVTLRVRNALHRANMANRTDPTTGLPAGILVQDQLRALMKDPEGSWALLRFRVRYLNPFRELYGFVAAKDLLRNVAHILAEALGSDDVSQDFLGYGGNDDFIVITTQERAPSLKDEVLARFKQEVHTHYGFMEAAAGHIEVEGKEYPLATLRVMIVTPKDGPFYDIRSLSEAIAG